MALRTMIAGASGAVLLAGLIGLATPGTAAASVTPTFPNCPDLGMPCQDIGLSVSPAQPYKNNPDTSDWFGSYLIGGKESWCVDFALAAPNQNEGLNPPTSTLMTKFGAPFDPPAAKAKLPASTQTEIGTMLADAQANHGPWTATMSAPAPLTIGTATNRTVTVLGTSNKGIGGVPVSITATDATLPNGTASQVINTPADGTPLSVAVTPTGPNPKLVANVDGPSPTPMIQVPIPVPGKAPPQITVTTGGAPKIPISATGTAQNAPGNLTVTKSDANTKAAIAGAS